MNQGIDAAVAKLTGDRPWLNEQLGIGPVSDVAMPTLGMQVVKSGRGSGVTVGMIDGVEGEYPIYYGGLWRKIKYVQRIVPVAGHNEVSRGGDSGSWWLEEATQKAVALHFAGYDDPETALAMAMPPVLGALNVEIAPAVERVERARTALAQPLAAVKV
jgi:endonuclease G